MLMCVTFGHSERLIASIFAHRKLRTLQNVAQTLRTQAFSHLVILRRRKGFWQFRGPFTFCTRLTVFQQKCTWWPQFGHLKCINIFDFIRKIKLFSDPEILRFRTVLDTQHEALNAPKSKGRKCLLNQYNFNNLLHVDPPKRQNY